MVSIAAPVNIATGICSTVNNSATGVRSGTTSLRRRLGYDGGSQPPVTDVTLTVGCPSAGLPSLAAMLVAASNASLADPFSAFESAVARAAGLSAPTVHIQPAGSPDAGAARRSVASSGAGTGNTPGVSVIAAVAAGAGLLLCVLLIALAVLLQRRRRRHLREQMDAEANFKATDDLPRVHDMALGPIAGVNPMGVRRRVGSDAERRSRDLRDPRHALAHHMSRRVKREFEATLPTASTLDDDAGDADPALGLGHTGKASLGKGAPSNTANLLSVMKRVPPRASIRSSPARGSNNVISVLPDGSLASQSNPMARSAHASPDAASGARRIVVSRAAKGGNVVVRESGVPQAQSREPETIIVGPGGALEPVSNPLRPRSGDTRAKSSPAGSGVITVGVDGIIAPVENPARSPAAVGGARGSSGPLAARSSDTSSMAATMAMYAAPQAGLRTAHPVSRR